MIDKITFADGQVIDLADQPMHDPIDDGPSYDPGNAGADYEQAQAARYGDTDPEPQGYDDDGWPGPKDAWDYDPNRGATLDDVLDPMDDDRIGQEAGAVQQDLRGPDDEPGDDR